MVAANVVHRARAAYAADLATLFREIVQRTRYHVTGVTMAYRAEHDRGDRESIAATSCARG